MSEAVVIVAFAVAILAAYVIGWRRGARFRSNPGRRAGDWHGD